MANNATFRFASDEAAISKWIDEGNPNAHDDEISESPSEILGFGSDPKKVFGNGITHPSPGVPATPID